VTRRRRGVGRRFRVKARHLDIISIEHHDVGMRTTLTLDPDVAARLQREMRRTGRGLKSVVNDALRQGLGLGGRPGRAARFVVRPHDFGFKPGVDLDRMNQLVDELEAAESRVKYGR
jgi:hypothetical protein